MSSSLLSRATTALGWVSAIGATGWAMYRENQWQQTTQQKAATVKQETIKERERTASLINEIKQQQAQIQSRLETSYKVLSEQLQQCSAQYTAQLHQISELQQKTLQLQSSSQSQTIPEQFRALAERGLPSSEHVLYRQGYVVSYDYRTRNPCWSCQHLRRQRNLAVSSEHAERANSEFREDPDIPEIFQSRLNDYRGSGYDRGHLTPAADVRVSQEAMNETFFLSNISPQVGNGFNRHYWARLEQFSRSLLSRFNDVYICSGPLYLPTKDENGKWKVQYEVIGNPPNVAVPTHFYKTILVENPVSATNSDKPVRAIASFVLPNAKISPKTTIEEFLVPLETLNRMSGLQFWNRVINSARPLCTSEEHCALPPPDWWKPADETPYPVADQLNKFVDSSSIELHFPDTLSPNQRRDIHKQAGDLGLEHFSQGEGTQRHVVVRKQSKSS